MLALLMWDMTVSSPPLIYEMRKKSYKKLNQNIHGGEDWEQFKITLQYISTLRGKIHRYEICF